MHFLRSLCKGLAILGQSPPEYLPGMVCMAGISVVTLSGACPESLFKSRLYIYAGILSGLFVHVSQVCADNRMSDRLVHRCVVQIRGPVQARLVFFIKNIIKSFTVVRSTNIREARQKGISTYVTSSFLPFSPKNRIFE